MPRKATITVITKRDRVIKKFSDSFKELIKLAGLTHEKISYLLGLTRQSISYLANGRATMSVAQYVTIRFIFDRIIKEDPENRQPLVAALDEIDEGDDWMEVALG